MNTLKEEREAIVEWRDGVIVEFYAYEMYLNEGGSETWNNCLSVIQRGIVLGDNVVGCDYELDKSDFINGVYTEGIDANGGYRTDEYLKAVLVEPEWLLSHEDKVRDERDTYWKERASELKMKMEDMLERGGWSNGQQEQLRELFTNEDNLK